MKDIENIDELIRGVSEKWEINTPENSFKIIRRRIFLSNLKKILLFRNRFLFISISLLILTVITSFIFRNGLNPFYHYENGISPGERVQISNGNSDTYIVKSNRNQIQYRSKAEDELKPGSNFNTNKIQQDFISNIVKNENSDRNEFARIENILTSNKNIKQNKNINVNEKIKPEESEIITYENQTISGSHVTGLNFNEIKPEYLKVIRAGVFPINITGEIRNETYVGRQIRKWDITASASGTVFRSDFMEEIPGNSDYNADKLVNGKGFSLLFSMEKNNFALSSGFGFSKFEQNFSADELVYNPTQILQVTQSGTITNVDSVSYWHYYYLSDSTIHLVDSVLEWREVTTVIQLFDSAYVAHNDTLQNIQWKIRFNRIEIPLTAGFLKSYGRYQFGLNSGFSFDLVKPVCGYLYNGKYSSVPFRNLNESFSDFYLAFSLLVSASFRVMLNEHLAFELQPYCKFQLNNIIIPEQNLNLKFRNYGVYTGLRYYF